MKGNGSKTMNDWDMLEFPATSANEIGNEGEVIVDVESSESEGSDHEHPEWTIMGPKEEKVDPLKEEEPPEREGCDSLIFKKKWFKKSPPTR